MKTKINTPLAPQSTNFYSQAIITDSLIFVAGQIHMTAEGKVIEGTVEEKLAQIMKNIRAILSEAHANLNDVVKATVYVTDIAILKELNPLYATYFSDPAPAREAVCVQALPLGATMEISVIAQK